MKNKSKENNLRYFLVLNIMMAFLLFMTFPIAARGQISDPGGDPDAPEVPIDAGASILLTISIMYGVKKVNSASKNLNGTRC